FGMSAFNIDVLDRRQSLIRIDIAFDGRGVAGPTVRTDETEGRTGSRHQNASGAAAAIDAHGSDFGERNLNRLRNPIRPGRKVQHTVAVLKSVPDGIGVIGRTVSGCSKTSYVAHVAASSLKVCVNGPLPHRAHAFFKLRGARGAAAPAEPRGKSRPLWLLRLGRSHAPP